MKTNRFAILLCLLTCGLSTGQAQQQTYPFNDPSLPMEKRIDNLLSLMTIDEKISRYTANYELKRISAVDRNILRVAIYEMLFCNDVPPIVAINEAIDIAKKFGTEESGKFVNGVLDRVKLDLNRPLRTAAG